METKTRRWSTRDLCYIGIFVAIMAVCAQVVIPFPGGVPFTLQTWAIALAGMVLGPKKGAIAVAVYILLGVVGAPVFSGFRGGLGVVAGVTGGFIVSFPVLAVAAGLFVRKSNALVLAAIAVGVAVNYAVGMIWFSVVTGGSLMGAFAAAVAPFILPDIFKMVAVVAVGRSIHAALAKAKIRI